MPTNNKEYMKNYMSKYNCSEKNLKYKMSYYEENKEKLQQLQRQYYHKHKNNPNYSHYLKHRLQLQREAYKENKPYSKSYNMVSKKKEKHFQEMRINNGYYEIKF